MKNFVFLLVFLLLASSININSQWVHMPNGMDNQAVQALTANGNNIYAGTYQYVYLSSNEGTNWSQTSLNKDVRSLATNGHEIFAGTFQFGVHFSTNNGANWSQTVLANDNVYSLAVNSNNVFAGVSLWGGIFLSK